MTPVLTTSRLILQPTSVDHAEGLFAVYSDARAMHFWHTPPHKTITETLMETAGTLHNPAARSWTVFRRDEPERVIGAVWYLGTSVPGMGYIMHPDFWKQGYGSEAAGAAVEHGFMVMGLNRIELWIHAGNIASQKLAYKLGFRPRAAFYQRHGHRTETFENLVFGLRADEWAVQTGQTPLNPKREIEFIGVRPVIRVNDVAKTIEFYRDILGFNLIYTADPPNFAIVSRGEWSFVGAQIHFSQSDTPDTPSTLYIEIGAADPLYEALRAKGVTFTRELETQWYGRREFAIHDVNGWELVFASTAV
jgi:ribosomal-protein-alanine N-acetyltransferase